MLYCCVCESIYLLGGNRQNGPARKHFYKELEFNDNSTSAWMMFKLLTHFQSISTSIPPENIRKPWVFRGYRGGKLVENELTKHMSIPLLLCFYYRIR